MSEVETDIHQTHPTARRLPPWVIILAFIILLGFLTFLGLGLKRAQSGPITRGSLVPPIELTTFDSQVLHTNEMQGKVIVINFWASWCKPCESEAADLEAAWKYYKPGGQVVFLGADYVDTEPQARAYLAKFGITYPNGPDLGTKISQMFRIRGVPETYIIDRNGKLAFSQIGPYGSLDEIKAMIDPLLQ